ncbi:hypothetical protein J437_LFUL001402 [Ladona fulva]|uniref:Uncharacterized protein n=1 Tax=Ladona fulva TaxID=123851 RepID=A0A8K0NXV2_LADFU|nr:hypothetical protein J437_LFUL001402 [Ladona fulva]
MNRFLFTPTSPPAPPQPPTHGCGIPPSPPSPTTTATTTLPGSRSTVPEATAPRPKRSFTIESLISPEDNPPSSEKDCMAKVTTSIRPNAFPSAHLPHPSSSLRSPSASVPTTAPSSPPPWVAGDGCGADSRNANVPASPVDTSKALAGGHAARLHAGGRCGVVRRPPPAAASASPSVAVGRFSSSSTRIQVQSHAEVGLTVDGPRIPAYDARQG